MSHFHTSFWFPLERLPPCSFPFWTIFLFSFVIFKGVNVSRTVGDSGTPLMSWKYLYKEAECCDYNDDLRHAQKYTKHTLVKHYSGFWLLSNLKRVNVCVSVCVCLFTCKPCVWICMGACDCSHAPLPATVPQLILRRRSAGEDI